MNLKDHQLQQRYRQRRQERYEHVYSCPLACCAQPHQPWWLRAECIQLLLWEIVKDVNEKGKERVRGMAMVKFGLLMWLVQ